MTPLVPSLPAPTLASADPQVRPTSAGIESAAAAPPALGLAAVTAVPAAKAISARADGRDEPRVGVPHLQSVDPPPDPPAVKGLGIPALHMARVGDRDVPDNPAARKDGSVAPVSDGFSDALAATDDMPAPQVDLRR